MPTIRIDNNSLKILHDEKQKINDHNKNIGISRKATLDEAIRSLKNEKN